MMWKFKHQEIRENKKNRILSEINKTKKIPRDSIVRIIKRHLHLGEGKGINILTNYLLK